MSQNHSFADAGGPETALAARYYTDPAVFEREKARIFFQTWQYAGHLSRVAEPGDYFTLDICGQGLFVIRGLDGTLRAFHNVCQHRAHPLLEGEGRTEVIICPYHAWTYHADGRLRRAPNSENVPGFDTGSICLATVRLEVFCGFVFVNLDADARPMAEWYPGVEDELRAYVPYIDDLKPYKTVAVEEDCNWKVTVENYNECYHCGVNHPTFARGVIDPKSYNVMPQGHCLRHTAVAANLERMTYAINTEANQHAGDYGAWFLWPAFSFQVYPGNLLNTYLFRPQTVDRTMAFRGWYTVGGEPFEVIDGLARQDRETTVEEDLAIVNAVQRGLNSRGYRPGPLVLDPAFGVMSEHSIKAFKGWVLEALAG